MYLEKKELNNIVGGMSASFLDALGRVCNIFYNIGYDFGYSLRRLFNRSKCRN